MFSGDARLSARRSGGRRFTWPEDAFYSERVFPATLFDFNGVLVDDEHVHLQAFRDAVRPFGIEIGEKEYWEELLGFDDAGAFEHLLKKAGLDSSRAEVVRLIEAKRPLYMERARASLKTFEGAAELISLRRKAGPVAVVSGALTEEIEFGLSVLGASALVEKIISAEDTTVSKPDPEGYLLGIQWLREMGCQNAERALVIEDSLDGIVSAKRAGLPVIAVAHSYSRAELQASEADLVLDRLADIDEEKISALYAKLYA